MAVLRWGIAGAGRISHSFVTALKTLPKSEHKVVAVGARDESRARQFSDDNLDGEARAHGSYSSLAADGNVGRYSCPVMAFFVNMDFIKFSIDDVVYVGLINGLHHDVVNLLLEAGKHVVCEKPLAVNAAQAQSMIDCARKNKRFLIEGLWNIHFPAMLKLKEELDRESIGEPMIVSAQFGYDASSDVKFREKEGGGGALLHLGVYLVAFAHYVFREKPESVAAVAHKFPSGSDATVAFSIKYPRGKVASLLTTCLLKSDNNAIVIGDKGRLEIPEDIWCPTRLHTPDENYDFTSDLPHTDVVCQNSKPTGFVYEAKHVKECIDKGLLESPVVSHEDSLQIAKTLDEIRKQANIVFDCDKQH